MGSSRLPGKVLKDLGGNTVLSHVLERCRAVRGADVVVCATTENVSDDPVVEEANRLGIPMFRGSELDLLDRYYRAAIDIDADVIMRVTSDCPLIDPGICDAVLDLMRSDAFDFACNNMPPTYPHGLDCEAFTIAALRRAWSEAHEPEHREHVSVWLRNHPGIRRANHTAAAPGMAGLRWTLDYPEDYDFFRALFVHLPAPPAIATMDEVLDILSQHPEISAINAVRTQRMHA